ncbi:hypothetical protein NL676_001981 [Syzygium grande]|nr:hypothetical protein NL676_001981 [Syzygium grande]
MPFITRSEISPNFFFVSLLGQAPALCLASACAPWTLLPTPLLQGPDPPQFSLPLLYCSAKGEKESCAAPSLRPSEISQNVAFFSVSLLGRAPALFISLLAEKDPCSMDAFARASDFDCGGKIFF